MGHQSLLWSITPPGGQPSFLFGTMHIRDDRAYQLCKGLYPLIRQTDQFIGEMDLDMNPSRLNPPIYNIHDFISEKKYQKLKSQFLKSFRLDLDHIKHLHPLMIMGLVSNVSLQAEHHISLDEHLWQYAKQHDKPTRGLESYEDQFRILHSIEVRPIYRQLIGMGRNPSLMKKSTQRGLDLYLNEQIHHLYRLSKSSMQHLKRKVIYERNLHMASVIDHLDNSLRYFITVGAGHLSGKFGLLTVLKKSGWTVKPIRDFRISSEE